MKRLLALSIVFSCICYHLFAQSVPTKVETKSKQRADTRVDQGIDKGLDKAEEAISNLFKKKPKKNPTNSSPQPTPDDGSAKTASGSEYQGGTKSGGSTSDFIPGSTVLFADNFEKDAMDDFPAGWNTNGSGKVVTISGVDGRWLEIVHNSIVHPMLKKPLPVNSTIDFDLYLKSNTEQSIPIIIFGLTPVKNILTEDIFGKNKFFTSISRYNESDGKTIEYGLREVIGNKSDFPILSYNNKVLHVSIAINKTRVRVYFDQTKLIDLPMALTTEMLQNFFFCNGYVIPASETAMYIGNIRIASAEVDARSLLVKDLLEKGQASTSEILFDVNKDVIKQESFPIINQIGDALKQNPSLNIKITGHTDSDGNAADNLSLSKKRAAAVSNYLVTNYGISKSRIATDGKGATEPVASNSTADGKAKNRRVEFTKL